MQRAPLIPYDPEYEFMYLEEKNLKNNHPVSDYIMDINTLSIVIVINVKWLNWGVFFLNSIAKSIPELRSEYPWTSIINNNRPEVKKLYTLKDSDPILTLNSRIVERSIENCIDYIWTENTKVMLRLELCLRDYLILDNMASPTLYKS